MKNKVVIYVLSALFFGVGVWALLQNGEQTKATGVTISFMGLALIALGQTYVNYKKRKK